MCVPLDKTLVERWGVADFSDAVFECRCKYYNEVFMDVILMIEEPT